jgi:hypothetical protein
MDGIDRSDVDWRELCERASKEQDPDKLMELVRKLNQTLEERRHRNRGRNIDTPPRQSSSGARWTVLASQGSS